MNAHNKRSVMWYNIQQQKNRFESKRFENMILWDDKNVGIIMFPFLTVLVHIVNLAGKFPLEFFIYYCFAIRVTGA